MTDIDAAQAGSRLRPGMDDVRMRWAAFWAAENEHPMVIAWCPKSGPDHDEQRRLLSPPYPVRPDADFNQIASNVVRLSHCFEHIADETPQYNPSFGPDQMAAMLGAKLNYSESSSSTSWSEPLGLELEDILPITLEDDNPILNAMDRFFAAVAEAADGRLIAAALDLHSNFDALAALRGPENACMDILDKPALVAEAISQINRCTRKLYDRHFQIGKMAATGTSCWLPVFSPGRYLCLACDFICLLSPSQSRRFVIPALEEELSMLDHALYHLDGPGALPHLDDILGLEKLRGIQWVPGDGNPQHGPHWFDLYKKILSRGKALWIYCSIEMAKTIHAELRSPAVIYSVGGSPDQVRDLLRALGRNA